MHVSEEWIKKNRENGKLGGRPKGKQNKKTLDKLKIKSMLDQRFLRASRVLANAQIHIATGQTFLYKIEKRLTIGPKGGEKWTPLPPKLVTSQDEIEEYLNGMVENGDMHDDTDPGATYYYMTAKEPSNEAIRDIMNRVHGMPKATVQNDINVTFSLKDLALRREALTLPNKIVDQNILENQESK